MAEPPRGAVVDVPVSPAREQKTRDTTAPSRSPQSPGRARGPRRAKKAVPPTAATKPAGQQAAADSGEEEPRAAESAEDAASDSATASSSQSSEGRQSAVGDDSHAEEPQGQGRRRGRRGGRRRRRGRKPQPEPETPKTDAQEQDVDVTDSLPTPVTIPSTAEHDEPDKGKTFPAVRSWDNKPSFPTSKAWDTPEAPNAWALEQRPRRMPDDIGSDDDDDHPIQSRSLDLPERTKNAATPPGGHSRGLRVKLDMNLDVEIMLKARIEGDVTLTLF